MSQLAIKSWTTFEAKQIQKFTSLIGISKRNYMKISEWRKKHNFYREHLNQMPEWSYLDGRGYGPPSKQQRLIYERDQDLAKTVVERMKELNEAKKF